MCGNSSLHRICQRCCAVVGEPMPLPRPCVFPSLAPAEAAGMAPRLLSGWCCTRPPLWRLPAPQPWPGLPPPGLRQHLARMLMLPLQAQRPASTLHSPTRASFGRTRIRHGRRTALCSPTSWRPGRLRSVSPAVIQAAWQPEGADAMPARGTGGHRPCGSLSGLPARGSGMPRASACAYIFICECADAAPTYSTC